ncbi:MAG: hypothetical protein AAGH15_09950 [Myxococcota bacterium]
MRWTIALVGVNGCSSTVVTGSVGGDAGVDRGTPAPADDACVRGQPERDADDDGLTNGEEGSLEGPCGRDTDGDGLPDFLDGDSDGDGIFDVVEAVPRRDGRPADSDGDGLPDVLDLDSDGNGLDDRTDTHPDGLGLPGDLDGDGVQDFRDADDDNDFLRDVDELDVSGFPVDSDGDGLPDHRDVDSDGDTILDAQDGPNDDDGDGLPNRRDLDADNDGIPDALEAGDFDPTTAPLDSDGDFLADFLDLDSDDDTVLDGDELRAGLSATRADTDGDEVPDAVEIELGTDGADAADTPASRGILFVLLPRSEPAIPEVLNVAFDVPDDAAPTDRALLAPTRFDSPPIENAIDVIEADTSSPGCAVRETEAVGDAEVFILDPQPGDRLCWRIDVGENVFERSRAPECDVPRLGRTTLRLFVADEGDPTVELFGYVPPSRDTSLSARPLPDGYPCTCSVDACEVPSGCRPLGCPP